MINIIIWEILKKSNWCSSLWTISEEKFIQKVLNNRSIRKWISTHLKIVLMETIERV